MNDLRQRLERKSGEFPISWNPEEGGVLAGELLYYTSAPTGHGDVDIAVVRDDETGRDFSVWLSRSVLKAEFAKHAPNPGDAVGIKFHGQKVSKKGSSYFVYSVEVDRATAA